MANRESRIHFYHGLGTEQQSHAAFYHAGNEGTNKRYDIGSVVASVLICLLVPGLLAHLLCGVSESSSRIFFVLDNPSLSDALARVLELFYLFSAPSCQLPARYSGIGIAANFAI